MSATQSPVPARRGRHSLDQLAELTKAELAALEVSYGQAMKHALKVGELLAKAKELCAHGDWLPWLKDNFELTPRSAQRYMLLAVEVKANTTLVSDLTLHTVRKGIASPAPAKPKEPQVSADSDMGKLLAKADNAGDGEPKQLPARAGNDKPTSTIAFDLIEANPGITIPELAARMGCAQNKLYRVLPGLEQEQRIHKEGRGWFVGTAHVATEPPAAGAGDDGEPQIVDAEVVDETEAEDAARQADEDRQVAQARAQHAYGEPQGEVELATPGVLTVTEERKYLAVLTQIKDVFNLLREAGEDDLSAEAVANTLHDASVTARRAAANLDDIVTAVEKRA